MPRVFSFLCLCFGLLVAASPASAQGPVPAPPPAPVPAPPEERIRAGVTVDGVDVGNLTLGEATLKLEQTLAPVLAQDVTVAVAGKRFRLKMSALDFDFRADKTALRALYAGRAAPPAPDGTLPPATATPSVAYKRGPLWRFAGRTAERVAVAPRDATVRIRLTKIRKRPGRIGRALAVRPLVKAIQATVKSALAPREVAPALQRVRPEVRTRELKRVYRTVITIDRASFRLRLFKKLRIVKRYGVAVGLPDYPTPAGLFSIQSKQVNPTWTAPNAPWAGELAGQQVSGDDPTNPLKARWMGVNGGVGIHGTGEPWTIGTRASHGCIRMTVGDVIDLFRRVPLGAPVLIA